MNGLMWMRGRRQDWDFYATETGDPGWNYESALRLYRRIERWSGPPDLVLRDSDGPLSIQPSPNHNSIEPLLVTAARSIGVPTFESPNGKMSDEGPGAASIDVIIRDGSRQSVFRAYVQPNRHRPNLTIVTEALVTRVLFENKTAVGVEINLDG